MSAMTKSFRQGNISCSRKRNLEQYEWEHSKENVVPLKRGRNVTDLNKALRTHDSYLSKLQLEDEFHAKKNYVMNYNGDDPLAAWLELVRWLEDNMPEDTQKKFAVLENCTRKLKKNPQYKNDMRYIRLWIQYADLVSNPKDIFKYLYHNKIGERVSLFYIGWAYVLETMANYPQAHKIYLKASQKSAEPQDLLEKKYKEFQRRMSRQWLKMTEGTENNDINEVTYRRALESLPTYGILELSDAQRQQLHQRRASARSERVQKTNAHKPVFIIYEDTEAPFIDPFDGNNGWKKLKPMLQQDKENKVAPSGWNVVKFQNDTQAGPDLQSDHQSHSSIRASSVQIFDDENLTLPIKKCEKTLLTLCPRKLRQQVDGKAAEEGLLVKATLKNSIDCDNTAQKGAKIELEKRMYDVKQITSTTGEHTSFEEIRAHSYEQTAGRRRQLEHRDLQNMTCDNQSVCNATLSSLTAPSKFSACTAFDEVKATMRTSPTPTIDSCKHHYFNTENLPIVAPRKLALTAFNGDHEDVTINTQVALEDVNNMFCSPPQPKSNVRIAVEEAPVELKPHFSVFDDSVDRVAASQSVQIDPIESVTREGRQVVSGNAFTTPSKKKQTSRIFSNDKYGEYQLRKKQGKQIFQESVQREAWTGKKALSEKRKPLGARDDLVRNKRLTNKDIFMNAQIDSTAKGSAGR